MSDIDVAFNPFEPGFTDDPYPHWRALREHAPVQETPLGFWVLTRYDDVQGFIRDQSLSVEDRNARPGPLQALARETLGQDGERGAMAMLNVDPPDHTRLRRLVSRAFTPRTIEVLRPRIQELVDDALAIGAETGEFELIGDLAFPIPFTVISEMLGMPETDGVQLREWSSILVRTLEPLVDPELILAIAEAGDHMHNFIAEAIEWKRQQPADDLLSALIAAEDEGAVLSDDELIEQVTLLYVAGHETTVNLIGNGVLALTQHPGQLDALRADATLDANAVEELLRYDPPVQMTRRITMQDVEVGGHVIESGTFVVCGLASGNRDAARWGATAETLDVRRRDASDHLAFGGGTHFCLGAALARLEGQVAIGSLARRFGSIELAAEPEWNGRINLRGLDRLLLAVG